MTAPRHVVLMGLMGSGKTTVGRLLADRLGRPFVDNDVLLEARTGRSARAFAAAEGADALHVREAEVLVDALYRALATLTVDADAGGPGTLADEISSGLSRGSSRTPNE